MDCDFCEKFESAKVHKMYVIRKMRLGYGVLFMTFSVEVFSCELNSQKYEFA